jgi:plasmid stability protein
MKLLQVRNIPDDLHRALKERAAREGTTMSDLVLRELPRLAHKPSPQQVLARIRSGSPVGGAPAAELIADERDRR